MTSAFFIIISFCGTAAASEPFLGQIKMFAFSFAPVGYTKCDGQILPINQNQSLYALLGSIYGGDGRVTFALPDMRGRMVLHNGGSGPPYLSQKDGAEYHVLTLAEMPSHTHGVNAVDAAGDFTSPAGNIWASLDGYKLYSSGDNPVTMSGLAIANAGGGQSHNNMPPYLVINYSIATTGLWPSRP